MTAASDELREGRREGEEGGREGGTRYVYTYKQQCVCRPDMWIEDREIFA